MHSIFVYGTLKRGFPNHTAIKKTQAFIGRFQTCERYELVLTAPWYSPVMIDERGAGHNVVGEVFAADAEALAELDRLEGTHLPTGYRRIEVQVQNIDTGAMIVAWVYVKSRLLIDQVVSAPMAEYSIDPRYVPPSRRSI
ncbi:MAG TPA: gamma-glutamylcyclotransferase family protein [Alphaproteobacteria bacterium]|nr:gamma-glutamylcyclotransferase family protein [Alphaproteobacteria bacterium]